VSAEQVLQICAALERRGDVANHDGNVSVRRPGGRFLCTPTAMRKGDVGAVDLIVVDSDGGVQQGRRRLFSEWQLHRAVYSVRADVGAVVHAHPRCATAMASAGVDLDVAISAEALVSLGPSVPTVEFAPPGDPDLSERVSAAALAAHGCLLANHGLLAWGDDLSMAWARYELIEHLCAVTVKARALGGARTLPGAVVAAMVAKHHRAGLAAPNVSPAPGG
jgi:L-fuculose-phosphate aldolase